MDLADFGVRELIMLTMFAAVVYLIVATLGLLRLRKRKQDPLMEEPASEARSIDIDERDAPGWHPPTLTPVDLMLDERTPEPISLSFDEPHLVDEIEPSAPAAKPFAATLAEVGLDAEVRQLRAEVADLRREVAELKEKRRVSPLYKDAAALAQRGFDAHGVAEECGISVAEAELVMAMSRDDKNFDSEVDDGAERARHNAEI
ncbi:MAG TPA: DUF2802 domain-containing protein [Rhodocyclaceae bacterium]|nr:DUF2802 domain-containing protein [Rhodocyclaceae bacterium]